MRSLLVAVCLIGLAACTPEEIAAVESAYRASVEAERAEDGPTWSVEADCDGAHVVLSGWTRVADISPSEGVPYVILGTGDTNHTVRLAPSGNADIEFPVSHSPGPWGWTLVINGYPPLSVTGIAAC